MNKVLLSLLIVFCFMGAVQAQNPVIINQPYKFLTWISVRDSLMTGRLDVNMTLQFPVGCSVPSGTASLNGGNKKKPAFYFDSCGQNLYLYNPKDSSWNILGSGGGGSVTSIAISSTDFSVAGSPITSSGTITLNVLNNAITNAKFRQSAGLSVVGRSANSTGNIADITATTANTSLGYDGSTVGFFKVSLSSGVTGILPVANGGTGTASPGLVAGTNVSITGSWPNQTINSTGGISTIYDSTVTNALNQYAVLHNPFRFGYTDSVYFFGDSYTAGSGASNSIFRWTTLTAYRLGGVEVNYGVAGGTLEKRSPVDYQGATNMIDLLPLVPTKTFNRKMIVIAYGLNDLGQTASAYNVTNFKTDYDSVIHYCINKGWKANEILLIPPYWIGYAGYQAYATITGNAAPTVQRHTDFVHAVQETATKWGCLYFNMFNDQLRNDTTLISSVDHIHPTDAGYDYIAWDVSKYISPSMNLLIGSETPAAVANPMVINTRAGFSNTAGDPAKIKICTYCDGTTTNNFGFGVASQEFYTVAGGAGTRYKWYINGNSTPVMRLGTDGIIIGSNVSTFGTNAPVYADLGGTFDTVARDTNNMKLRIYSVVSNGTAGFSLSSTDNSLTGNFEYMGAYNNRHIWYRGPSEVMRIDTSENLMVGTSVDNRYKLQINGSGYFKDSIKVNNIPNSTTNDSVLVEHNNVVYKTVSPKTYTALLTQSGTSDPTAAVLGNNTVGSIVWTRNSAGNYTGTLSGAFTSNKTWLICQKGDGSGSFVNSLLSRASANAVTLDVRDNSGTATDNFTNLSIEIRVYP